MEQMIYKLSLPPLEDCLLEGAKEKYLTSNKTNYFQVDPVNLFKPEILKINNLDWKRTLIFHRPQEISTYTHTDTVRPGTVAWGINWIYNGIGIMEYWNEEDFETIVTHRDAQGFKIYVGFREKCPPRLKYWLEPGAYLVNATKFHKATGIGDRYCVSFRTMDHSYDPWNQIVDSFKYMIIQSTFENPEDL